MSEIKTRETKRDIKVLDKAGHVADKMKDSTIKTKSAVEQTQQSPDNSASEYAIDRVTGAEQRLACSR